MELYTTSPNIFSDHSIAEGPQYIEHLFELLVGGANRPLFDHISVLEKLSQKVNAKKRILILFYKGYYYQRTITTQGNDSEKADTNKKALANYEAFLREKVGPPEIQYYAQWQAGLLQESLHYPWRQVQYTLLKARPLDPLRAEAHTRLIRHYLKESNWPLSYLFNSFSKEHFYNNCPARKWGIDPSCYNWRILDKQWAICAALGNKEEMGKIRDELALYFSTHKNGLGADEYNYISQKLNPWTTETGLQPIR